jgi:hypothetical protein
MTWSNAERHSMPTEPVRYRYVCRQQLKVGSELRQPGEEIPEAADWPPQVLKAYLNTGQIEEIPDPDGVEHKQQGAQTFAPEGYDKIEEARVQRLAEARRRSLAHQRQPAPDRIEVSCRNCRSANPSDGLNYVPESQSEFQCWSCGQQQTVAEALGYPPQTWDDVLRVAGVRPGGRQ